MTPKPRHLMAAALSFAVGFIGGGVDALNSLFNPKFNPANHASHGEPRAFRNGGHSRGAVARARRAARTRRNVNARSSKRKAVRA